ncbi:MAG: hypothetical protein Q9227_003822 [Pyrenula ochraceoflavens]
MEAIEREYRFVANGVDFGKAKASISLSKDQSVHESIHPSQHSPLGKGTSEYSRSNTLRSCRVSEENSTSCTTQSDLAGIGPTSAAKIKELPNEVIDYIVSFLDTDAPSNLQCHDRPSLGLTRCNGVIAVLKSLSITCKLFRSLALRFLFKHARLDPIKLTDFLAFLNVHNLQLRVQSVVAVMSNDISSDRVHPLWWAQLLMRLRNITSLTILSDPTISENLFQVPIIDAEHFAFNAPYHTFRFCRSLESPIEGFADLIPHNISIWTYTPWKSISINEGSSLKAYSFYEYFLRRTPSLLSSLNSQSATSTHRIVPPDICFAALQSFEYTALFPFYNHTDEVLKSIRKMKNIHTLSTKLCHSPNIDITQDEGEENMAKVDMNDAWMEHQTSYNLIVHTVKYLATEGKLLRWRIKDIEQGNATVESDLVQIIADKLPDSWSRIGQAIWADTTREVVENNEAVKAQASSV